MCYPDLVTTVLQTGKPYAYVPAMPQTAVRYDGNDNLPMRITTVTTTHMVVQKQMVILDQGMEACRVGMVSAVRQPRKAAITDHH